MRDVWRTMTVPGRRLGPAGLQRPKPLNALELSTRIHSGTLLAVSIYHPWDLVEAGNLWKGFSEDPARTTSRAGDIGCGAPWSPQRLVAMARAVVGRVEEAGHLGGAELGPVAAAVCP